MTNIDGDIFTGTLDGFDLSWSGSYLEDAPDGTPGIATIDSLTATIDASCNSLTGSSSWTWSATDGSGYVCSGTTTFTGTRTPASGCVAADSDPTGLWVGSFVDSFGAWDLAGIVVNDQVRFVSLDAGAIAIAVGTISVSGTSFTASTTDYAIGDGIVGASNFTGTFAPGATMSGSFSSSDGNSGTFSLTYDAITDFGSSLSVIEGTWVGPSLSLTISSTGALSGTDTSSCSYQGAVSIIDPAVNIYAMTVNVSSCFSLDGAYTGYAVISDSITIDDTMDLVINSSGAALVESLFRSSAAVN
jgi:hypothetical protein